MPTAGGAKRRLRPWHAAALALPLAVALQWLASCFPAVVESLYAERIFPIVAHVLGLLTGWLPFSLAEAVLLLGVVSSLLWLVRRPPWRVVLRRVAATAGLLYAAFLLLWGFCYDREPLAALLGLDVRPSPASELQSLCSSLVSQANELRAGLPEDSAGVLRSDVADVLARAPLGLEGAGREMPLLAASPVTPKPILASRVFSHLGISGIYSPFTGEANVNTEVPAPDLPFAASHEMAHQRGIAREDEANFVAWLACRRHPDRDYRYSGTLSASLYGLSELARTDAHSAHAIAAGRSPAVARDIAALVAWAERYRGTARTVSRAVNDAYLRAHGQEEGVRSYGRMVDLLLAEERRSRR
jgi:Protein of unknown function (DUF3810)